MMFDCWFQEPFTDCTFWEFALGAGLVWFVIVPAVVAIIGIFGIVLLDAFLKLIEK